MQMKPVFSFTDDNSFKSQLVAQDVVHPLLRSVSRHIFNVGVSGHNSKRAIFGDASSPRRKDVATKHSIRKRNCAAFKTAQRFALSWKISK